MKCWTTHLIGCLLILASYCTADTLNGKVVKVADGDTITVLDSTNTQHRIRLTGIDAPEKGQPFGNVSKQRLTNLVAGKMVMVEYTKKDRYGRILGKVWVQLCSSCEAMDANLAQVTAGMAWWYRHYQKDQPPEDRGRYESAEDEAKARRIGLWGEPGSVRRGIGARESGSSSSA